MDTFRANCSYAAPVVAFLLLRSSGSPLYVLCSFCLQLVAIQASAKDPSQTEKPGKRDKEADKKKKHEEELSEEDKKIKEDMELLVERLQDVEPGVVALALQTLSIQLKAATSSMTSVPKPLKFLRPHIPALIEHYQRLAPGDKIKEDFAMVLSVLCTTCGDGKRRSLHFCLEGGSKAIESWGFEFLRNLSGEVAAAYAEIHGEEKKAGAVEGEDLPAKAREGDVSDRPAGGQESGAAASAGKKGDLEGAKAGGEEVAGKGSAAAAQKSSMALEIAMEVPLPTLADLNKVVDLIVPYYMSHNAECDAVDLLSEMERIESVTRYVDASNFQRVSLYLLAMTNYAASLDEYCRFLSVALDILCAQKQWFDAMRVALKLPNVAAPGEKNEDKIKLIVDRCREEGDPLMVKQLALLLGRQGVDFDFDDEQTQRLNSGEELSNFFLLLAKEMDVLEPKTPEDVYKTHLEDQNSRRAGGTGALDSAKQNLASTFVNAFVNAGSCKDKLMLADGASWLYKNKDHGMISAAASLGAILLWNIDEGLSHLDKYQYSSDANIKAGALLGFGVLSSNVRHECDAAFALLKDHLEDSAEGGRSATCQRVGAVIGLGCAYAGTKRADVMEALTVVIVDSSLPVECSAFAAVSLGLVFVGSCNQEAAEAILTTLIDRSSVEKGLESPLCFYFALGVGLLFLGARDACEPTLTALEALSSAAPASAEGQQQLSAALLAAYAQGTVEGLAYAGSGDVLKAQKYLSVCSEARDKQYWSALLNADSGEEKAEKTEKEEKKGESASKQKSGPTQAAATTGGGSAAEEEDDEEDGKKLDQAVAVMNLALLAFAEDVGAEMSLRMMDHLLQYADLSQRRAVPLALAINSPSRAKPGIIDTLSKLSHDVDAEVALNAIFAMGVVGAGTNNARIAGLLRSLASYYGKDGNALFVIRLAQGLLYMGKGLLTINPLHSDRFLINNVALGSLAVIMHTCLHMRTTILGRFHYLLYYLFPAMQPRMLFTVAPESQVPQAPSSPEGAAQSAPAAGASSCAEEATMGEEKDVDVGTEELKMACVSVRVGEAVDVVGQVGRQPKTITAFQTHTSPVLLSYSERAELATDEYIPVASVLEGVVILKKNPDFKPAKNA
ncbi:proteasome 26S regulatory subunit [Besnoitia besnoiti]|uniref:Proteasome 26S regulatory subunit n=1 Tax=Besnoitia besnoiti TaxID=94643 RepID=A0A2A9M743_BESBE|nr:proteasome 26S regulatory subunit [Besnoitia besnoiti]PFH34288.1 proteasome 26S regulatory subunit [Besnoitia besnoiti]